MISRSIQSPPARSHRPAVVEHVGDPQSTSDGRAANPDPGTPVAGRRSLGGQVWRFAAIGIASTAAWAVLYLLLRGALTPVPANAVALIVTAIGNTAANRRVTFGVRGRQSLLRDHAAGLVAFGLALSLTSGAALLLDLVVPHAGRIVEVGVLTAANLVATTARFVVLRTWIGRTSDTRQAAVRFRRDPNPTGIPS